MTRWERAATIGAILALFAPPAFAVEVHWATHTPTYHLNANSFTSLGINGATLIVAVGADRWRTESDSDVRLVAGPETTSTTTSSCPDSGGYVDSNHVVVLRPYYYGNDPLNAGVTGRTCKIYSATTGEISDSDIEIFNGNPPRTWSFADLQQSGNYDLYLTIEHELGHFLGLEHSIGTERYVMKSLGQTPRQLGIQDIAALSIRYGTRTSSVRHKYSTNGGTSWTTKPGWVFVDGAIAPFGSIAVACRPGLTAHMVAAYIDTDGSLKATTSTTGSSWSVPVIVDGSALGPHLNLTYGGGQYLLTYQKWVVPSSRRTYLATSSNGTTWVQRGAVFEADAAALTGTTFYSRTPAKIGALFRDNYYGGIQFNSKFSTDGGATWTGTTSDYTTSAASESWSVACDLTGYCLGASNLTAPYAISFVGNAIIGFAANGTPRILSQWIPSIFAPSGTRPSVAVRRGDRRFVVAYKDSQNLTGMDYINTAYSTGFNGSNQPTWSYLTNVATSDAVPSVTYCGGFGAGEFWMLYTH